MNEKPSRDEMFYWLRLYGEDLKREQWEEGERVIGSYIAGLEEELQIARGATRLAGWDET